MMMETIEHTDKSWSIIIITTLIMYSFVRQFSWRFLDRLIHLENVRCMLKKKKY